MTNSSPTWSAVIVAAGNGSRFGQNKLLYRLGQKTVLERTLSKFTPLLQTGQLQEIVLVVNRKKQAEFQQEIDRLGLTDQIKLILGGHERWESSLFGIEATSGDIVGIHDAARPFVTTETIVQAFQAAGRHQASVVAVPSTNSIKLVNEAGDNLQALPRASIWLAQTPQVFDRELILQGFAAAQAQKFVAMTDEAELITNFLHLPVKVVPGFEQNMKITFTTDLPLAQEIAHQEDQSISKDPHD